MSSGKIKLDGKSLTLEQLCGLCRGDLTCGLSEDAWALVEKGRAIAEAASIDGDNYYGLNTGVGSQKEFSVNAVDYEGFNARIIVGEATDFPGHAFAEPVVRGALAVMLNNAATGRLGVRPELVQRMLDLFACTEMPAVRSGTSSGMADLGPLAQLALPLIGRSLDGSGPVLSGPFDLAAKEAVSLINCNAFAIAHGALVLEEVSRLLFSFDLAAAATFEGFRANISYYAPQMHDGYKNPGQIRSCKRIAASLEGSRLWDREEWRALQDPLSFRFAMRTHGAAIDALSFAEEIFTGDLNCVCDNPVVSLETGSLVTGVNMDSTPPHRSNRYVEADIGHGSLAQH